MNAQTRAPTQFTAQQIRWIMSHDWFYARRHHSIVVNDNGSLICWTQSFNQLRIWAGY